MTDFSGVLSGTAVADGTDQGTGQGTRQGTGQPEAKGHASGQAKGPLAKAPQAKDIVFDTVSLSFGRVDALKSLSLAVRPGEVLCLLGQSGCGKTSLLRLAAGIERPSSGSIRIDGQIVAGPGVFVPPERRGVGLVFQDYALFPHLTNLQNVMFGLTALPRAEAKREARAALARVGLEAVENAYPHELSGGQQQRIALARAMAPRPGILLLDEPFSGLDTRLREEVRASTLAVLRDAEATSIIVTHDPEEALRLSDRVALLRQGSLVQVDTPEALYRFPADLGVARFFCELNELAATARGGRVETPLGIFAAPRGLSDGRVVVAVRSHGLHIAPAGQGCPARVIEKRFLGPIDLVEVMADGFAAPLSIRTRHAGALKAGDGVSLTAEPSDVLVFAAGGA